MRRYGHGKAITMDKNLTVCPSIHICAIPKFYITQHYLIIKILLSFDKKQNKYPFWHIARNDSSGQSTAITTCTTIIGHSARAT